MTLYAINIVVNNNEGYSTYTEQFFLLEQGEDEFQTQGVFSCFAMMAR